MTLITSKKNQETTKENTTCGLLSKSFLTIAFTSLATSVLLKCMARDKDALLVCQLITPFLLLGINYKETKAKESE